MAALIISTNPDIIWDLTTNFPCSTNTIPFLQHPCLRKQYCQSPCPSLINGRAIGHKISCTVTAHRPVRDSAADNWLLSPPSLLLFYFPTSSFLFSSSSRFRFPSCPPFPRLYWLPRLSHAACALILALAQEECIYQRRGKRETYARGEEKVEERLGRRGVVGYMGDVLRGLKETKHVLCDCRLRGTRKFVFVYDAWEKLLMMYVSFEEVWK